MVDKIIIGAGIYGLYAALYCVKQGQSVVVLEQESKPFTRATYVNQARVHMGYHYPRSLSTAMKSAGYFKRFVEDYAPCIHSTFDQVYATSALFSWTNAREFQQFCKNAGIPCQELSANQYFNKGICDGAFLTKEYTFDAQLLGDYFCEQLADYHNIEIKLQRRVARIVKKSHSYEVYVNKMDEHGSYICEEMYEAPFVLNAAYASVNQVLQLVEGVETIPYALKYELCEIILCHASPQLQQTGITVMDGPFFSIMPFGKTGLHSLTSVTFTPHKTCHSDLPGFCCQEGESCTKEVLGNCNACNSKPKSAWEYMAALARKYLKEEFDFSYNHSLFTVKPILKTSEIDDSRPTVIKFVSKNPTLVSVLSGKMNTIYDLDDILVN